MERTVQIVAGRTHRWVSRLTGMRALWAVLLLAVFAAACGGKTAKPTILAERVSLRVDNRGFFDVTVYAVRSGGGSGTRLGNVSGGSTGTLWVRVADLQPGGRLVVRLRAIGTRRTWTSPAVTVTDGLRARLNVFSTNSGEMSQSTLIADYSGD